jgi:hypothetical protein
MLVPSLAQSQNNRVVLGSASGDFSETLIYNNELVEFFTMGDYPKQLEMAIRSAAGRNVNIFICACSRHAPLLMAEFRRHRTAFIAKTFSANNDQRVIFNTADAQTLLNMI